MKIHQIFVQIIQFVNKLIFIITRRRRLDDQLYWQFFIHPKDLEALLNKPGNFMNKIPPFGLTLPPFTSHFLILPSPLFKTFFFQIFLHLNKFWYFFRILSMEPVLKLFPWLERKWVFASLKYVTGWPTEHDSWWIALNVFLVFPYTVLDIKDFLQVYFVKLFYTNIFYFSIIWRPCKICYNYLWYQRT